MNICFSPLLIAAYHVFLRLLVPSHPPYALSSLTYFTVNVYKIIICFHFGLIVFTYFRMLVLPINYFRIYLYIFQCANRYFIHKKILCQYFLENIQNILWWAQMESNHRPHAYQACALTIWAMSPYLRVRCSFFSMSQLYFKCTN